MTMDGSRIRRGKDMYLYDLSEFHDDPEGLVFVRQAEIDFYNEVLDRVIANPRFYLDKLDVLPVFMVHFKNNHTRKTKGLNT